MESSEIGRIKLLIYLSILGSFVAGIVLLFVNFEEGKSLIEIHSSTVIFPLFVPFLIGLVCLYSSRRKNVSQVYLPITLLIGAILLFYFQIGMFALVGNYAFIYLFSTALLLSSSVTSFIFVFSKRKKK